MIGDAPAPILVVSGPSGAGKTTVGRLVAATFDLSVHIQSDHFWPFLVSGWVEPSSPDAEHQNDVLGGAVVGAALVFAEGGYTVVLDGHLFPEVLDGLESWAGRRGVPLHYAVLRPGIATCLIRVRQRNHADADDAVAFARHYSRFADLGEREAHVVEAEGTPEEVAAALLAAFSSGLLRVVVAPLGLDGQGAGK